jgi:hypothetical protein
VRPLTIRPSLGEPSRAFHTEGPVFMGQMMVALKLIDVSPENDGSLKLEGR